MIENWQKYQPILKVIEGGKVDDPEDPGGRTNMGVTQRTYNQWRKGQKLPVRDVYQLEMGEWAAIMKSGFWDTVRGDEVPAGIDTTLADASVNSGPSRAIKFLQQALGVAADGVFGQGTMNALQADDDNDALIAKINAIRLRFMRQLKTWKRFGGGWTSRVNQMTKIGQAIATGSVGPQPVYAMGGERKARIEDAKAPPPKTLGDATGVGGIVTASLPQVQEALAPASNWGPVSTILTVLAVVGGIAAVGGFWYSAYARRKEKEREQALALTETPEPSEVSP